MKNGKPRVIFYDIETAPSLGYYFDLHKEGNIVSTVAPWFMLSFAYKVQGESKTHFHCLADYPAYNKDRKNDKALVTDLHRLVQVVGIHFNELILVRPQRHRWIGVGLCHGN